MKVNCEIIEDLLPLYVDNVCSKQSRQAVEEHLRECEKCRSIFESTQAVPVPHIEPDSPVEDKAIKKGFRKIRIRWWAAILIILAMIPIAFLGWNEYSGRGAAYSNQHELTVGNGFMDCLVEMGAVLDDAGGIESYNYVGISLRGEDNDGTKIYRIIYKIRFAGKETLFHVDVSEEGVEHFGGGGSFVDDPLAQFSIWAEYLWQDYEGCYFDPELGEYVYYTTEP